ncbi:zinc-dependent metalloprotease [Pseudohongiella sp.]|uniref:Peptidase n=1 Tax=marine sediment metagenome TaxID=412755 RepID=A0A0F9Z4G3_9ZZZZ|nr:zinc-dependent metalloprotease [Pseudohongiella sp.]
MKMLPQLGLALLLPFLMVTSVAQAADAPPAIAEAVAGAQLQEGYFDFYYQPNSGQILLAVDRWDEEFLYTSALATGVGSNDIGLDRGQLGGGRVVKFERHGNKVFLKHINLDYRADSDSAAERLSVQEAFAESILAGFDVEAADGDSVLIDLTDFLLSDVHGVASTLARSQQGSYSLDKQRSAVYMDRTRNFPLNSEFEAQLTFAGSQPGALIRSVTPSPGSVTVRQHHSFVQLPGPGYEARAFHPESGFWSRSYEDFAAPINEDMTRRYISRHRLHKRNPQAARSEAVEPIIYYLDAGVPEPVRSALLDGARWWNDAFAAIGFDNAFQVEILPEDADPMDIRYNVIQWVHRSTRGWSYGSSVTDPRTGEIIKGKVTLGSLRVRQDYRIAQSLIGLAQEGSDEAIQELALSRIRQLSAHEVGHTLGIAHNFAASVNSRASVMDYPHPALEVSDAGVLDALNAYDVGLGQWDFQTIKYGYAEYATQLEEAVGLAATLQENKDAGLYFISDADSRAPGGGHPLAHMWDNGADPVTELERLLDVRSAALQRFGAQNLRAGQPYAELEEILVPLYFLHRYQVEAVHRLIGGMYYEYSVYDGESAEPEQVSPIAAADQMRALDALMQTLAPDVLALSPQILATIPPKPVGYSRNRESFPLRTSLGLDFATIAETAADHTLSGILQGERLARLINQHSLDPTLPSIQDVLDRLLNSSWFAERSAGQSGRVQQAVNNVVLYRMLALLRSDDTDNQVKAAVNLALRDLEIWLDDEADDVSGNDWRGHYRMALDELENWSDNGAMESLMSAPLAMPPGAPI